MGRLKRRGLNALFLFAALAAGCGGGYESQVRRDFSKEHPNYQILSVGGPDGNDTKYVTFHIRYKKPGDGREYWSDWAYLWEEGKITFVGKGPEVIASDAPRQ